MTSINKIQSDKICIPYQQDTLLIDIEEPETITPQAKTILGALKAGVKSATSIQKGMGIQESAFVMAEILKLMESGLICLMRGDLVLSELGEQALTAEAVPVIRQQVSTHMVDRFNDGVLFTSNKPKEPPFYRPVEDPIKITITTRMIEEHLTSKAKHQDRTFRVKDCQVETSTMGLLDLKLITSVNPLTLRQVQLTFEDRNGKPNPEIMNQLDQLNSEKWKHKLFSKPVPSGSADGWSLLEQGWCLPLQAQALLEEASNAVSKKIRVEGELFFSPVFVKRFLQDHPEVVLELCLSEVDSALQRLQEQFPDQVKWCVEPEPSRRMWMDDTLVAEGQRAVLEHQYGCTMVSVYKLQPLPSMTPKQMRAKEIRTFVRNHHIPHLTHFTPLENLESIVQHGIVSRAELAGKVEFLFTDDQRLDGRLHASCLSFSFPNHKMFYAKRMGTPQEWAILILDPALLWNLDCGFTPENAASSSMRSFSDDDLRNFQQLQRVFERHGKAIASHQATDVQAEVMVFERIPTSYIRRIEVNFPPSTEFILTNTGRKIPIVMERKRFLPPPDERRKFRK